MSDSVDSASALLITTVLNVILTALVGVLNEWKRRQSCRRRREKKVSRETSSSSSEGGGETGS